MTRRALLRRVVAALALVAAAFGSALFWGEGNLEAGELWPNLLVAAIGLAVLHFRWRAQERRALTPRRIRDTFE
ncbi:hypothetical protein [Erythrobacter sp. HL-111]|uniref:hypothetical protein n=1 Tax=Erythrobacter sp. HL-111 TaxID=1798193 RepID=UPI0006DB2691|nr:hypothetical protein [Erythrobacter sp. HL-111]KPP95053.1 MAG: Uncharacterized protein family (UPF0104) [Erythrobacteraceae bacterium HL-111]SDS09628.1 hypothetical protein SAMN04515621_0948 [Erythrobacter sp. HL-111]